jgi:molecular chaperone GrpE
VRSPTSIARIARIARIAPVPPERISLPEQRVALEPRDAHCVGVQLDPERIANALRELEAAKARVERDAGAAADALQRRLVADLLPVLDNLDRTIAASGEASALVEGVRMVRTQLEAVLRGYGVERIDVIAHRFDPSLHDAVGLLEVGDRGAHDTVVDQLQPCYRHGRTLLRAAKVVVGRYAGAA